MGNSPEPLKLSSILNVEPGETLLISVPGEVADYPKVGDACSRSQHISRLKNIGGNLSYFKIMVIFQIPTKTDKENLPAFAVATRLLLDSSRIVFLNTAIWLCV